MNRQIIRDILFLGQKSEEATQADLPVARDLMDTLAAHRETCVGLAANMIGVRKRIIVVQAGLLPLVMLNPRIVAKSQPFEAEEGCLSLDGTRKTTRYQQIEVEFRDMGWKKHRETYTGWTAQIIQHEVDHCDGVVI